MIEIDSKSSELAEQVFSCLEPKPKGRGWLALCPCHADSHPSLRIDRKDGLLLYHCDVCGPAVKLPHFAEALGIGNGNGSPKGSRSKVKKTDSDRSERAYPSIDALLSVVYPNRRVAAKYRYGDRHYKIRFESKKFIHVTHDGSGWMPKGPTGIHTLYRADDIKGAERAYVTEGEKACDALCDLGLVAVSSGGAQSAKNADWSPLSGLDVCILPDNDDAGARYAADVAGVLGELDCKVKIVALPGLSDGGDFVDWVEAHDSTDDDDLVRKLEGIGEGVAWRTPDHVDDSDSGCFSGMPNSSLLADFRDTDTGRAELFVRLHGENLRYCALWRQWYVWDGIRWRVDDVGEIHQRAGDVARRLYTAAGQTQSDRRPWLASCARKADSARARRDLVTLAQSEPTIAIRPDVFDTDPWLLNCENGTIDLREGTLRKHERADLITKVCPVSFDPQAKCPKWLEFLKRIMAANENLIEFLQRATGFSISGSIREQVIFLCHGEGANGKSSYLDCVREMLGDYASSAAPDLLTIRRNEEHPTQIADLMGKRLVVACETEEGKRLRTAFVKQSTGDATLKARRMRQDYFEFRRTHKTWLVTNHKPRVSDFSKALWRRIKLVPFTVTIPEAEQDHELLDKFRDEWPGILAWTVAGCLVWQEEGLPAPDEITEATDQYRREQDVLSPFIEECCELGDDCEVSRTDIYSRYRDWAKRTQERYPLDRSGLYERLRAKGFEDANLGPKDGRIRGFTGIRCAGVQAETRFTC